MRTLSSILNSFLLAALLLGFGAQCHAQTPAKPAASAETVYRNAAFGFHFRMPYGWVDRTKEMREGDDGKNQVLLAIFERPPQAAGDTINSAVVIAAEGLAAYPGLKRAEDYLGPLAELTATKGFKVDGDPSTVDIDSRQLVRADFVKPLNDKLTMHQSTLVLLAKGQIVSFTFIAESTEAVNDLIEGLGFSASKAKPK